VEVSSFFSGFFSGTLKSCNLSGNKRNYEKLKRLFELLFSGWRNGRKRTPRERLLRLEKERLVRF